MHGGIKFYRGSASAARSYVEQDRSRADDYYLAEGSGVATRYVATPDAVNDAGSLTGEAYEQWVAGYDVETGAAKGQLRKDKSGLRFVEITVNGPKTWSLAAALHPEISAALDAAQDRAAEQIIGWAAANATTRVGPRGRQVQVPVSGIEAAVIRHYTSRAGDPHRHLHVQVNARVLVGDRWRGLHSVWLRDSIEALNGIGHAAVMTDPGFRAALAAHGFTLEPTSGEIVELVSYVGRFSDRTGQIARNIDRYEAEWRTDHPGAEPGPRLRQAWDRRSWAEARPDKVVPADGAALVARWNQELHQLGYRDPAQVGLPIVPDTPCVGALDRDEAVAVVLARLGARRSAWNTADIRGEVEKWIAASGMVTDAPVRVELAEDLSARALEACTPLLEREDVPHHVRAFSSAQVLDVEADIVTRLIDRAEHPAGSNLGRLGVDGLDLAQRQAVAVLAGDARLIVVEGAAGAGKTTTLSATKALLKEQRHRLVVVAPTLKAAHVAAREVGTGAYSAARLAHQHGWRWDGDGAWTREPASPEQTAVLSNGDLLLIDEAGMLDQDTARALLTIADEAGARVALVGDRHQLPAVGRGGVLDLAARWVRPDTLVGLDMVHRFADPDYADLSLVMRRGEHAGEVFDALLARDQIRVHASETERTYALAEHTAAALPDHQAGSPVPLVMADTRAQAMALNGAIRDRLVTAGRVDDKHVVVTSAGERLGVGDRVATRLNDRDLDVANRQTWTITAISPDGTLTLRCAHRTSANGDTRAVPAVYGREQIELAYATTVYGAQGETTSTAHLLLGEHTAAAAAYVAMTRGREANIAHLVADTIGEARAIWEITFSRDRADLGPAHAREVALDDIDRNGTQPSPKPHQPSLPALPGRPLEEVVADLRTAWTQQADLLERCNRLVGLRDRLEHVAASHAHYNSQVRDLSQREHAARQRWLQADRRCMELDRTIADERLRLLQGTWTAWRGDQPLLRSAAATIQDGAGLLGQRRRQVHDARDTLTAWADKWREVVPRLPSDPDQIIDQFCGGLMWLDSQPIREAIDVHVERLIAQAHPDQHDIHAETEAAHEALYGAEAASSALGRHLDGQLAPYGYDAYLPEPQTRLARTVGDLERLEAEATVVADRIQALCAEPALRSLPPDGLEAAHDAWQAERTYERETQARERAAAENASRTSRWAELERRRPIAPFPVHGREPGGPGIGF